MKAIRLRVQCMKYMQYITILCFLLCSIGLLAQMYVEKTLPLYQNAFRFHVRANSDSAYDQSLKRKVRDAVLDLMRDQLENVNDVSEAEQVSMDSLREICMEAKQTLEENGCGERVCVSIVKERFPVRDYGQAIFPAGVYQALRVDIGEAKGHNWWCALYPSLCYQGEWMEENAKEKQNEPSEGRQEKSQKHKEQKDETQVEKNQVYEKQVQIKSHICEWIDSMIIGIK